MLKGLRVIVGLVAIGALLLPSAAAAQGDNAPTPIIFVHGNSGSAQQFESSMMRFTSNGFPQNRLFAYEYDTSASNNDAAVANLVTFVENVKRKTGASQVDIVAHSRGTLVSFTFLKTPENAANVKHYVNLDGAYAEYEPGNVETLALWAEGDQTRHILGAENVYFPNRAHTEVASSSASFARIYEFLEGEKPETKAVVPENPKHIRISGRALSFPVNVGIDGGELAIYEVDGETGARLSEKPIYTKSLDAGGHFGPVKVNGTSHYELAVKTPAGYTVHNYPEPFERSDRFYRVLDAPPLRPYIEQAADHTNISVTRMREWWGDQTDPVGNDTLSFNGFQVINPAIAPRKRRVLAVFNFDKNSDGVSDTSASLFPFNSVSFLTGVDNYMPSSPDHSGTIAVKETMRGAKAHSETINVPNWPSTDDTVSVFFRDYAAKTYKAPKGKGSGK
ncbi:MAG: alpha/beta hydrolase [Solirubrobacterales bacterium]